MQPKLIQMQKIQIQQLVFTQQSRKIRKITASDGASRDVGGRHGQQHE
jgi:hypothetical protein